MTKLKALLAAGTIAAGVGISTSASALLVNTWEASYDNGFDSDLTTFSAGTANPNFQSPNAITGYDNTFLTIAWGTPSNSLGNNPGLQQSKLTVSEGVYAGGPSVEVQTNGATEQTIGITHFNNVIQCLNVPAGGVCPALQTTTLVSQLTLSAIDPALGVLGSATEEFKIQFVETKNQTPCFEAGLGSTCDDIFVLLNPEDLFDSFTIDVLGTEHKVQLGAKFLGGAPLQAISDLACAEAGLASGCVGFLTKEAQNNTIVGTIKITALEVPEPGTLAMLGALLVAGGVASRRKRA